MDTLNTLGDLFSRFRDSPGGAALLLIAALLAIPVAIVAMVRWVVGWFQRRKARKCIERLAQYVAEMPGMPVMTEGLFASDEALEQGVAVAADIAKRAEYVNFAAGKGLRLSASLPFSGRVDRDAMTAPLSHYEWDKERIRARLWAMRSYLQMRLDDGTL